MNKKIKAFIKWPKKLKKLFFACLFLALFFDLLKKIVSLETLLNISKKPHIFIKPSFSEEKLFEACEMVDKISNNLIKISCMSKVLILKKYFANSEILEIIIGIRSKNNVFESHAWINNEAYLKLENDEFMSFKKLYEYS